MAFLDQGISEAYVSPQIEVMLSFTQAEWLNDLIRWFNQLRGIFELESDKINCTSQTK